MEHETLAYLAAAVILIGLTAYILLGGADFGGGVWDLFATGPRRRAQRQAINRAMGPVWEANHVWLIFVIVALFTCFPYAYAALATALFIPFHLALVGIMLRGAAFVFRGYGARASDGDSLWGHVFGAASVISPFLLGAAFGAITAGDVRVDDAGNVTFQQPLPWLSPYAIGCGLLALSACAYLAAVYLTVETDEALREDFRRRAIIAGTTTAALAAIVLVLAWREAGWFFDQLVSLRSSPILAGGLVMFAASAWAVFGRKYRWSRVFAAGEIILLLIGWAAAHQPYLVYPDLTIPATAGPPQTVAFMLISLPFGGLLLVPALWLLFKVFKTQERQRG